MDPTATIAQYGWPIGSLIIALGALLTEFVVLGSRLRKMEAEKDKWQQLALELGGMSRSAMSIAERHVLPRDSG